MSSIEDLFKSVGIELPRPVVVCKICNQKNRVPIGVALAMVKCGRCKSRLNQ